MTDRQGYYARKGSYVGTTDDRSDRWYIGKEGEDFRPLAPGYRTRRAALDRIAELISEAAQ